MVGVALGLSLGGAPSWAETPSEADAQVEQALVELAPSPGELVAALTLGESRVSDSAAMGHAARRVHNALGAMFAAQQDVCKSELGPGLVSRAPLFVTAWRDAAQVSRAQLQRVERLASQASVQPVLAAGLSTRLEALQAEVAAATADVREAMAWHERFVAPLVRRCGVAPSVGAGLPVVGARPELPVRAVLALGPGRVCPADVPAEGEVVLVGEVACVAEACPCAAASVLPGAVVGVSVGLPAAAGPEAGTPAAQ